MRDRKLDLRHPVKVAAGQVEHGADLEVARELDVAEVQAQPVGARLGDQRAEDDLGLAGGVADQQAETSGYD